MTKPTGRRPPRVPTAALARPKPWTVAITDTADRQLAALDVSHPAVAARVDELVRTFARHGTTPGANLRACEHAWKGWLRIRFGEWRIVLLPQPRAHKLIVGAVGRRRDERGESVYFPGPPPLRGRASS